MAAVFRRAAEVITRNGLYQGHYFDDTEDSARTPSERRRGRGCLTAYRTARNGPQQGRLGRGSLGRHGR
ncbi:DUF6197 family protein [Streptomyces syringium]|uniref:DUF6197 family protein n=1 Tax=Streptomyces syringium TaxID=76729 RepID=UPI003F5425C0